MSQPMQPFTLKEQKKFIRLFLVIFYLLAIYKWINGLFLYQLEPHFFNLRFDPIAWMVMKTGIHEWLIDNRPGWFLFDALFYTMPLIWYNSWKISIRHRSSALPERNGFPLHTYVALIWLLVNWIYVQCYTLYPSNSVEGHIAWLLMPLLFAASNLKTFYLLMQGFRYYFLFFFVSAAIWKFRQGGLFNIYQMSGILLEQHKQWLLDFPTSGYTSFIYYIIRHPLAGWFLYLAATALELVFLVGFSTKKLDRWLLAAFALFLLTDFLIMRIPYFEIMPLALPLLFWRYGEISPVGTMVLKNQANP